MAQVVYRVVYWEVPPRGPTTYPLVYQFDRKEHIIHGRTYYFSSLHFHPLRWPNTVFGTCVSFMFFSKTLDPFSPKMAASKLTTQTSVFRY